MAGVTDTDILNLIANCNFLRVADSSDQQPGHRGFVVALKPGSKANMDQPDGAVPIGSNVSSVGSRQR